MRSPKNTRPLQGDVKITLLKDYELINPDCYKCRPEAIILIFCLQPLDFFIFYAIIIGLSGG